jgi:hypothetical protein
VFTMNTPNPDESDLRRRLDGLAAGRATMAQHPDISRRRGRTRVANHAGLLPGVSGASIWAKRFKELQIQLSQDKGGVENISASEQHILRRASAIIVECEFRESAMCVARAEGGTPTNEDLDIYQRLANSMRRLLESVGLERRAKQVGPSFSDMVLEDLRRQREREAQQVEVEAAVAVTTPEEQS